MKDRQIAAHRRHHADALIGITEPGVDVHAADQKTVEQPLEHG